MHRSARLIAPLAAAALASAIAMAQPLDEQSANGVTYVTGGVGGDESAALRAAASRYALEVELVAKGTPLGEHLSDAMVEVRDAAGKTLVSTPTKGPFFLANLPPGRYTVVARSKGASREARVDLAKGEHQRVVIELAP